MDYINSAECAKKWGIGPAMISKLCKSGRIEGAVKQGKAWMIPSTAEKPKDKRSGDFANFTFIDLFCGIGGFHQAMAKLGGRCVFASDISLPCQEVYKNNYCRNEEFPVVGDIRRAISKGQIPKFDVLCAGFPCQTFSKAGNQNGFTVVKKENGEKDERGQLFYRIIDILRVHPECKYLILENVRNLADKKDNWKIICDELKSLGFIITEEPIIESPHHFGIPQVRERVYILGIRGSWFDRRRRLPKGYLTRETLKINEKYNPCAENGNCLGGILDAGVDEKYYVSPEIEELLNAWEEFRANVKGLASPFWTHKAGIGIYDREEYLHDSDIGYQDMPDWKKALVMKSRVMYEDNYAFIDEWLEKYKIEDRILLHQKFEWNAGTDCKSIRDGIIQIRQSGVRVKRPNYFPSLVVMKNTPIVWDAHAERFRKLTPKECAKLQSFDSNFVFSEVDSTSYRQLGNTVNVELIRMLAEELFRLGRAQ